MAKEQLFTIEQQVEFIDEKIRLTANAADFYDAVSHEEDWEEESTKTQMDLALFVAVRETLKFSKTAVGDLLNKMKREVLEDA